MVQELRQERRCKLDLPSAFGGCLFFIFAVALYPLSINILIP